VLGHPLVVTMSVGNSPQRARMLEALGAEVVLIPQVDGEPGRVTRSDIGAAMEAAERIVAERNAFYVDQFNAPEGPRAHERTGAEIAEQAGRPVDGFCMCVGTGATFVGIARALKARNPGILCGAVEPEGCEPLGGGPVTKPRHLLQGSGYAIPPPQWQPELMDLSIAVSDQEAETWRRRLATEQGLHVGYSAAANVCAASRLLSSGRLGSDAVVATILCDTGLKY
jgi:cysteine synthase A